MHQSFFRSLSAIAACVAFTLAMVSSASAECTQPVLLDTPLPFLISTHASYPVAADFNEDGILDLAITAVDHTPGSPNSAVAVLIGLGSRDYAPRVLYSIGGGADGIVARDFNEDGILDLAVTKLTANNVTVLLGQGSAGVGNGTFGAPVAYPTGPKPFELCCADFNGDGILDLATALNGTNAVCVLPGLGSGGVGNGAFGAFTNFPSNNFGIGIATSDFNHDGFPDLVSTEYINGSVAVFLGTGAASIGSGSFAPAAHYGAGVQPYHIEIADFNEDGNPDLAVANTGGGGVKVLVGSASGTFVVQASVTSGNSTATGVGDVNGDGILDLVTGTVTGDNTGTSKMYLGLGSGGVWSGDFGPEKSYPNVGDVFQVMVSDLDGDGFQDALVTQGWGSNAMLLPGTCEEAPPDPRFPVLTDVRDVPNDNGGVVFLTWTASSLDAPGGAVNSYRVWRRIPPAMASRAVSPRRLALGEIMAIPRSGQATMIDYWEALATLPAQRLPGYGYTAATTQDSMKDSNPYTAFFVSALTSNIDVFYSSNVDSGYSVDNLKPGKPGNLAGTATAEGFSLTWEAVDDPALAGYRLYRGTTDTFVPSDETLIATPTDPEWLDAGATGSWYYKLTAVDAAGNESDVAELSHLVGIGPGGPVTELALMGAHPNPSLDGRLTIHFALPDAAPARLDLVDLAGRRVVRVDLTSWGIGTHVATLGEGAPLRPGIYFARLIQGTQTRESKVVVAR